MRRLLFLILASCSSSPVTPPAPDAGSIPTTGTLPCEVQAVLETNCLTCHGATPTNMAPMSLVTYEDLVAKSPFDTSMTVAQRTILRINDTEKPMPPLGAMPQADIDTISSWIAANYPSGPGGCDSHDPFAADPTCTKNTKWTRGNQGSSDMNPGLACIKCHDTMNAPVLTIAGTVYPSAHEPDLCNGGYVGAQVIITDANGKTTTLPVRNISGNFYAVTTIAKPFTAKVTYMGRTRVMNTPQMDGDCNKCHTQDGATQDGQTAPGRILLP
jgi:mono/diheme cytochrome c family protein